MVYLILLIMYFVWLIYQLFAYRHKLRMQVQWTTAKRGNRNGYIYVFRGVGEAFWEVKLGRTNNLDERLRSHRTANPRGIKLLCAFRTKDDVYAETVLHRRFKWQQINREWFTLSLDLFLAMQVLNNESLRGRHDKFSEPTRSVRPSRYKG